jgi:S-adenosylmethionine hydrolase
VREVRVEDSLRCVPAVFFLSDYGSRDEFAGVVHAVLDHLVPGVRVIHLTHQIPAFDVRAGALALHRALPHLGQGVVLAVVDPGVGTNRRCIALECAGHRQMVAPDNGLLSLAASELGVKEAVTLDPERVRELCVEVLGEELASVSAVTFDGRDLMAPAAALLARGVPLMQLGAAFDPGALQRISIAEPRRVGSGFAVEISWIDGFGNVQLWATPCDLAPLVAGDAHASSQMMSVVPASAKTSAKGRFEARLVRAFGDLTPGELGMLVDSDGRLALVMANGSAAQRLEVKEAETLLLFSGQAGQLRPAGAEGS